MHGEAAVNSLQQQPQTSGSRASVIAKASYWLELCKQAVLLELLSALEPRKSSL